LIPDNIYSKQPYISKQLNNFQKDDYDINENCIEALQNISNDIKPVTESSNIIKYKLEFNSVPHNDSSATNPQMDTLSEIAYEIGRVFLY
jgi:hypothetical protein